jgi:hypothetical protein
MRFYLTFPLVFVGYWLLALAGHVRAQRCHLCGEWAGHKFGDHWFCDRDYDRVRST